MTRTLLPGVIGVLSLLLLALGVWLASELYTRQAGHWRRLAPRFPPTRGWSALSRHAFAFLAIMSRSTGPDDPYGEIHGAGGIAALTLCREGVQVTWPFYQLFRPDMSIPWKAVTGVQTLNSKRWGQFTVLHLDEQRTLRVRGRFVADFVTPWRAAGGR